jgi:2-oxoglutarate ferredoxin oxidoreductase subunit beta
LHRLVAEVVDESGLRERAIAVAPVGCAVVAYEYWNMDGCEAAHGRALAVATALKRVHPDKIVFTYQGDGDLAAIGTAETIHAANRGENLTTVFVNNAVYGMTGGQMAPTTLLAQKTATTPAGRTALRDGRPLKILEILALLEGVVMAERVTITTPKGVLETKRALREAFQNQIDGKGYSIVEVLSPCPTYWHKSPADAMRWIDEEMVKTYPIGKLK